MHLPERRAEGSLYAPCHLLMAAAIAYFIQAPSDMKTAYWEHYAHEADIGIRGIAASKDAAFAQAARALTAVITDPDTVRARTTIEIHCHAPDDELLLFDWLNAIIYQMATRHMLFSQFDIRIEDHHLAATLSGEPIDLQRHHPAVEIKGATLTTLHVGQNRQGLWQAQCVVDV